MGCIFIPLDGRRENLLQRIYLTEKLLKGLLFLASFAWWAKGKFTPENVSHWNFVKGMIIPSRFCLMGKGRFYSRECISQKFCKRDDYSKQIPLDGRREILLQRIYLTEILIKGWLFLADSPWWVKGDITPEKLSHRLSCKEIFFPSTDSADGPR